MRVLIARIAAPHRPPPPTHLSKDGYLPHPRNRQRHASPPLARPASSDAAEGCRARCPHKLCAVHAPPCARSRSPHSIVPAVVGCAARLYVEKESESAREQMVRRQRSPRRSQEKEQRSAGSAQARRRMCAASPPPGAREAPGSVAICRGHCGTRQSGAPHTDCGAPVVEFACVRAKAVSARGTERRGAARCGAVRRGAARIASVG